MAKKPKTSSKQTDQREDWRYRALPTHPARGLTPAQLHAILVSAEQGDLAALSDLFRDMEEKDTHIFAEMSKRKRAVAGLPWAITTPKNPTSAELAQTELVQEWFDGFEDFEDVLADLLDAIGKGYAAIELTWAYDGRYKLPTRFDAVAGR